jgi:hypothetical protein
MNSNFDQIKQLVTDCDGDVTKFFEGNNAAGSRVRAVMQNIKKLAQEVRKEVQAEKNARKTTKG